MEKVVKFKGNDGLWRFITKKQFRKIVKRWQAIREAEKLMQAVEESE